MKTKDKSCLKYINSNIKNTKNKTILLNGATGSIGYEVVKFLSYLNNNLIILARNVENGLKIKQEFESLYKNKIDVLYFDYLNKDSINDVINYLKNNNINLDIFINISGIYHQKYEIIDELEKTYLVNYLMPIKFINDLFNLYKDLKVIITDSVTYHFNVNNKKLLKINNKEDYINYLNSIKNKTKRYGITKRLLLEYLTNLKYLQNKNIIFAHPGISGTNLFKAKNKAFNKVFYLFVPSLMKLIFMSPNKASLSLIKACDVDKININRWIGPRAFIHCWGYPKIYKLSKKAYDKKITNKVYELTNLL